MNYVEFMRQLSQKRRVKKYVEIGVQEGSLLSAIHADEAYGIDPAFQISANVCGNKRSVHLFQCTSDEAFADAGQAAQMRGADLVFLDGYHTFEFLLRDFTNVEKISHSRTLVGMHDTLPLDDVMIMRDVGQWRTKTPGSTYEGWWTGDVWKTVAILKKYRPDLEIVALDCPPTGAVFLTNLDPSNRQLDDDYLKITREFMAIENSLESLDNFYASIPLVRSDDVIYENNHSLYFKT